MTQPDSRDLPWPEEWGRVSGVPSAGSGAVPPSPVAAPAEACAFDLEKEVNDSFPLYADAYLGSSRLAMLTAAQEGTFNRLLAHCWQLDGLPEGFDACRSLTKPSASDADVRAVLEAFFPLAEDGRRRNGKQELARQARARFSASQQAKAQARWNAGASAPASAGGYAGAMPAPDSRLKHKTQDSGASSREDDATHHPVGLKPDQPAATQRSRDVQAVVDHYRRLHPRARPGPKERAKIAARLKEGYSVADICRALDGYHENSPWHNGENPSGAKWLGIVTLLQDSDHVAKGLEHADGVGARGDGLSEKESRTRRAGEAWLARDGVSADEEIADYEIH